MSKRTKEEENNELEEEQNQENSDAATEEHSDIEENEEEDNLAELLEEQKDKYLRLVAEFDNYKKRTSRENLEIRQTASKDLMISLLDVLDDIDRAEEANAKSEEDHRYPEGIQLIFNKLRKSLQQKGLKAIETLGTEFDVEKDEAISEIPVTNEEDKGKVVAEVQKGYMLNDRIIRFAKVVVGK